MADTCDRNYVTRIAELEAQVATLTAELATERKPRWGASSLHGGRTPELLGRVTRMLDGRWWWCAFVTSQRSKEICGVCSTEAEAKAAAEKACDGEVKDGDV